jgi:putative acyl-CoA dehydrogenase
MDWSTHSVSNQVDELRDVDLLAIDPALQQHLRRLGAAWALPGLHAYGTALGRSTTFEQAAQANAAGPVLQRFDARGRRIDEVRFHPDWHALLTLLRGQGWMARPFADRRPGRWAAAAAGMLLHGQVEAGTLCPATMTQAAIPVLRRDPALWAWLGERLLDARHDPSDQPIDAKPSIWLGMGMTEKQGGSDVRANTTTASPSAARTAPRPCCAATSGSTRPPAATPTWWWRARPRAACPATWCRAGGPTAGATRCASSA